MGPSHARGLSYTLIQFLLLVRKALVCGTFHHCYCEDLLIGFFLFLAAYQNDPVRAQGIGGVLTSLLHQPYGPWLLALVALGLIAFGIYSALSGLWLRLKR